jgi:hypothetical protein
MGRGEPAAPTRFEKKQSRPTPKSLGPARLRIQDKDTQPPRSQLKPHHPVINETLAFLSHVELPLMKHNRFAGLTAFCMAESR